MPIGGRRSFLNCYFDASKIPAERHIDVLGFRLSFLLPIMVLIVFDKEHDKRKNIPDSSCRKMKADLTA